MIESFLAYIKADELEKEREEIKTEAITYNYTFMRNRHCTFYFSAVII